MLKVPYIVGYLREHFADYAYATLDGYERAGGYRAARKALTEMAPADLIDRVVEQRGSCRGSPPR